MRHWSWSCILRPVTSELSYELLPVFVHLDAKQCLEIESTFFSFFSPLSHQNPFSFSRKDITHWTFSSSSSPILTLEAESHSHSTPNLIYFLHILLLRTYIFQYYVHITYLTYYYYYCYPFIPAFGLLADVTHVNVTVSPILASVGPEIFTSCGATEIKNQ